MKILVIGKGGREHALSWKLAQSEQVSQVYCAPGNAGTHREPKVNNIDIDVADFTALSDFVKKNHVTYTVVGPEAPLVSGIVDHFRALNLKIFGPNKLAAQLEGSKIFAKEFMQKNNIPTGNASYFSDIEAAKHFLKDCDFPVVIKADGLAEGKGVSICEDKAQAEITLEAFLGDKQFGNASANILIEEFLEGVEISYMVIADGQHFLPLASSQDHKARDNGDKGPNTGGMGAYSPAPMLDATLNQEIVDTIVKPTLAGMINQQNPYTGFLYFGLMITKDGKPKVLEYNCRMGDPETQPIMLRLKSDLAILLSQAMEGSLSQAAIEFDDRIALGVVLTEKGYPGKYQTGNALSKLKELSDGSDYKVFYAGTAIQQGEIVSQGGRVLCATALANTYSAAQKAAYKLADKIAWDSAYYRTDIGYRALAFDE